MKLNSLLTYILLENNRTFLPKEEELFARLLSIGGKSVCKLSEEDTGKLIRRGKERISTGRNTVKMPGDPSKCHRNTAALWDANKDRVQICTGWALSPDGILRQHSWGLFNGEKLVETTAHPRSIYFGFVLTTEEAELFDEEQH